MSHNIYSNSRLLSTAYQSCTSSSCTSSSLRENYYCNNVADPFAAEKVVMMMKPSVGKSTNPGPSIRDFVDTISRILASLLTYGVVFTFLTVPACFYASNSALAASNGKIRGSGSSSSSPSSYDAVLSYYRLGYMSKDHSVDYSNKDEEDTCTCDTSCTDCIDREIRKNSYKVEEEEEENNSSTDSCSCNCHSTCYFHKKHDFLFENILGCIVLAATVLLIVAAVVNESEYSAPRICGRKKRRKKKSE